MLEFEGKVYVIDFDKLMSLVTDLPDVSKEKTKTETWGYVSDEENKPDFRMIQKEVAENTTNGMETFGNIKYDFMKNLLNLIVSPISDDNGNLMRLESFGDMYFGQKLAFNTLINEGIIIEITED